MAFVPSAKQAEIFRWVKYGQGSAVVIAVAGSGKSTTMVQTLPHIDSRDPVLMLAFNASIAKELKEKVETLGRETGRNMGNVRCKTFHSLGFAAVCKRLNKSMDDMKVDDGKVRKIARHNWDEDTFSLYGSFCTQLVGLAKGEGIRALSSAPDERWFWNELIQHHDLFLESEEASIEEAITFAQQLLILSNKASIQGSIDYDDMLYLPILWKLAFFRNRWVIVDEAQDTNPVRRYLAHLALRAPEGRYGGRLIAVGDPNQGIYGFTGASANAIDLIKSEFNCIELPLTVSYRCPKAVGRIAQQLVPYFEVHENAPEGEVLDGKLKDMLPFLGSQDAILCRNTKPLVALAYKLMSQKVACRVLGSEIGKGLIALIKKMEAKTVDGLATKLEAYREREVEKFLAKEEESKAAGLSDRVACVMTFIENMGEGKRTLAKLIANIEELFTDNGNVLTLCTAHKSKGREWGTVAILEPELMPAKARQEWQQAQEQNLIYVSVTRAQQRLIYLQTEKER